MTKPEVRMTNEHPAGLGQSPLALEPFGLWLALCALAMLCGSEPGICSRIFISPSTHRPRGRPGGYVSRYGAGFTKTNNDGYLNSHNGRNDAENDFWNSLRNSARFSAGYG